MFSALFSPINKYLPILKSILAWMPPFVRIAISVFCLFATVKLVQLTMRQLMKVQATKAQLVDKYKQCKVNLSRIYKNLVLVLYMLSKQKKA